jgi:transcriptional regulator with XRE-family HTH domain
MDTTQAVGSEADSDVLNFRHAGPTVVRMVVGAQLRRLREATGITLEDAGRQIRASHSKMSRLELGRHGFKPRDVADLLTHYGMTDPAERATLLALARQANEPPWWHQFSDVVPPWFEAYLGLEHAASVIRSYEVQFIPGLLQTPDYARAVMLLGHDKVSSAELAQRSACG